MTNVFVSLLVLIVGFILLMKGADFFVEGSSSIATRFHIPSLIIGLTIVAMGTSLPECAVSITASMEGNNALAVANAVGSNIFNLMVVCGISALFVPIAVQVNTLKREFPFSVLCAILLMILGYFGMILGHIDGIVLLILFVGYIVYMIVSAKKAMNTYQEEEEIKVISMGLSLVYIVGGAIAIKFGGDFVVDSASNIALSLGMSQNLVGLTIVALGTSLPELVTSMVAAKKGEVDMALGNVIGSNVFNILFVLGIAATISPITFIFENIIDILILTIFSLIVLYFGFKKRYKEIYMKKIVFLDIDGTLVTPNYPLSDFVKKGIKKARENGHLIFLCTGRNRVGIESIMSDDFDGCICSAGGYLEIKGEMIETTYLDKEEVEQARKVFEQNHILYNLESTYMTFASEELRHYFAHALLGDEGTNSEFERLKEQQKKEYHMVDISKYQDQGIHKLCFIAFNREDIEKTKILLPNYHFIVHEMFSQHSINGEIIKKGMDKGLAIKKVVETLHMKMEDTIAFGDSMNDYEMLQVCNYGVAMKNACQELKASADNICESVENDGVYYEMERLGLFECLDRNNC